MSIRSHKQIQEFKYVIKNKQYYTHTNDIYLLSQENQDYNNQHDQQLTTHKHGGGQGRHNQKDTPSIVHKHNGGVQWVKNESETNSNLEEKEEWFYQWADNYDMWDNNSYTPTNGNRLGDSPTFNGDTDFFNLTKTKYNG